MTIIRTGDSYYVVELNKDIEVEDKSRKVCGGDVTYNIITCIAIL